MLLFAELLLASSSSDAMFWLLIFLSALFTLPVNSSLSCPSLLPPPSASELGASHDDNIDASVFQDREGIEIRLASPKANVLGMLGIFMSALLECASV